MKTKNYYYNLIKQNKIIQESETKLLNGNIDLHLILSNDNSGRQSSMTNNEIAKIVQVLVTTVSELTVEMREGFKRIDNRIDNMQIEMNERFDKIEQRLDEHDVILKEHTDILKQHSETLAKHSAILEKHSAILEQHSAILEKHSNILERNNLR